MKKILTESAAVANGIARSLSFNSRDKAVYQYENSYWKTPFIGGSHEFLVNGVSDLAVSAASRITYGLFVNDTLVPGATTPHDFAASAKTQNISITEIAQILLDDEIQIKLMSDTAGIVVTVTNLKVTFWGGY